MLYVKAVSQMSLQQLGETFHPVARVSMGKWYTAIFIDGVPDGFNSSHFKFYKDVDNEFVEHDIFNDPMYNPYI